MDATKRSSESELKKQLVATETVLQLAIEQLSVLGGLVSGTRNNPAMLPKGLSKIIKTGCRRKKSERAVAREAVLTYRSVRARRRAEEE
ncbi:MAG TPA: hypothetical protein VGN95_14580 [Pyrinomonadaceae bacterium]|jgi:hypothetical protein|nr:hypothetical protein [Pyrinomonadaceae bacterium]